MVARATTGFGADVWRWSGLGKVAARIWCALENPEMTIDNLCSLLGVTRRTVRQHLARMERLGLVRRDGLRWVPAGDPGASERAASILGVLGTGERQRQRHRAERIAFHARQEGLIYPRKARCTVEVLDAARNVASESPSTSTTTIGEATVAGASPTTGGKPEHASPVKRLK